MADSSSVSDTESAFALSHQNPGSTYSEFDGITCKRSLGNSNEPRNNLYRNPYVDQAALTTICKIHRTARDRLNLVPDFSQQQRIRLDEVQLRYHDVLI